MNITTANKHNQQIERCMYYFKDKVFKYMGDTYCWVAGGAMRGFFTDGYVKSDIDVFFRNKDDLEKASKQILKNEGADIAFESERLLRINAGRTKYDLVKRYFSSPKECISQFDFTVTCCAADYEKVIHHEDFFIDLCSKKLIINELPFPLATMRRVQKYVRKGFSICNGGILQIAKALSEVDYDDPDENFIEFYPGGTPRFVAID